MVSNLKIFQCIQKLWPGQENEDGRTRGQMKACTIAQKQNSHCCNYVSSPQAGSEKNKCLLTLGIKGAGFFYVAFIENVKVWH